MLGEAEKHWRGTKQTWKKHRSHAGPWQKCLKTDASPELLDITVNPSNEIASELALRRIRRKENAPVLVLRPFDQLPLYPRAQLRIFEELLYGLPSLFMFVGCLQCFERTQVSLASVF